MTDGGFSNVSYDIYSCGYEYTSAGNNDLIIEKYDKATGFRTRINSYNGNDNDDDEAQGVYGYFDPNGSAIFVVGGSKGTVYNSVDLDYDLILNKYSFSNLGQLVGWPKFWG